MPQTSVICRFTCTSHPNPHTHKVPRLYIINIQLFCVSLGFLEKYRDQHHSFHWIPCTCRKDLQMIHSGSTIDLLGDQYRAEMEHDGVLLGGGCDQCEVKV